ncbi:general secretion pathway protein D [Silvibacterium bohemicum]|uniref:General secretion pathway protein D n=1 Tax=Silvibacterium bohemicum TaxID=1577686 RepID=A0A841JNR1_9BACT|nr:secretin N-terminal domain-containing protein [Silvibacterium bohemicum]MBB6142227.1 general secretion pathway protein D [Silvibacterium bohemicum]
MNFRISKWAILTAFALMLVPFASQAHAQSANKLFKQGQAAEEKNDLETAFNDYSAAFQKNPKDERFRISFERLRTPVAGIHVQRGEKLRDQGDTTGAVTEFLRALEIDPSNELAQQDMQAARDKANQAPASQEAPAPPSEEISLQSIGGPIHLKPLSSEPLTLHSVEDTKVIYQTVGKLAGVNVLFDPDYTSKRVQVDLTNVDLYDALRIIGITSGTFWRPITPNTIFVAQNSRSKRTELEEQAVQTFYLTNVSQQNDFTDVQTALRNMFQTAKIYGVASQNAIIMRGTPDELMLAQKLVSDLDRAKPEVVVDVAVLEVSRNYEKTIGIQLPQTASVAFQASNNNATSSSSSSSSSTTTTTTGTTDTSNGLTLNSLAHLNGTNFAVTLGQASANLLLSDAHTKILQNPRVRASDGQEASLKIGERLPVATGSYQTGAATAIVSSLVNTQFQYLDIGVNITIKPTVHYDRDVSLKLKIEVSGSNSSQNLGGVNEPIITQRIVEQTVRLKDGEANMLGGILQKQTNTSLNGTPGLASVPILKYIFSSNDKTISDDEIVFLLVPHVVRATMLDPNNLREIDSGTSNSIELRHINLDTTPPAATPAPAARPQAAASQFTVPQPAGVPPSAANAAAAAIASMQMEADGHADNQPVKLGLTPEMQPQKVGSTFQMAVTLAGGSDVFSVPLQLQYDQAKLNLINVDLADSAKGTNFLGQDGQAVALVHRDDGSGNVAISASRPPGTHGISGSGTVCLLTFQAKSPGDAAVVITRPVVRNSAQQSLPATGARALVQVKP